MQQFWQNIIVVVVELLRLSQIRNFIMVLSSTVFTIYQRESALLKQANQSAIPDPPRAKLWKNLHFEIANKIH